MLPRRATAWRGAIDALRPFTQEIWQALSVDRSPRFLRHLRPWWDVHRHRMPPSVAARIDAARASGQLRVQPGASPARSGRARRTWTCGSALRGGDVVTLRVARVVNCSGPCTDVTRSGNPLMRALLRDGLARPDPCRLGLDATTSARGARAAYGVGLRRACSPSAPLTRGVFWEITAIPDIRRQCETLALHLSDLLCEPARRSDTAFAYA